MSPPLADKPWLLIRSGSPVEVGDEFPVGRACGVEFLIAFLDLAAQVDDLLLQFGDPALELVDVGRGAQPGRPPRLLAEQFGQLGLQLSDPGGLPGGLTLCVGQVRLKGGPADHRSVALGCCRVGLYGAHLAEQIGVTIEESAVDPGFSELAEMASYVAAAATDGCCPAKRLGSTLSASRRRVVQIDHRRHHDPPLLIDLPDNVQEPHSHRRMVPAGRQLPKSIRLIGSLAHPDSTVTMVEVIELPLDTSEVVLAALLLV